MLSIGWCPHDPSLLISTGRDGRALLWDVNSGEVLSELPSAGQGDLAFETKWSPLMPGVFSCSTTGSEMAGTEGKVSVCETFGACSELALLWHSLEEKYSCCDCSTAGSTTGGGGPGRQGNVRLWGV